MTKRTKRPTKRTPPKPALIAKGSAENRAAEAATVAWTLASLATAGADLVALVLWLLGRFWPGGPADAAWLFLPLLALFIAAVSGLVCLVLTPLVYRLRTVPPPPAITLFAVAASGVPLGILVALFIR